MTTVDGNEIFTVYENMAEIKTEENPEDNPKRRRKRAIDDEDLWRTRDHLVWLSETTWFDVGGKLWSIRNPDDVGTTLQVWQERSQEYIVKTLLRPSSKPATSKSLSRTRRQIGDLNAIRMKAWAYKEQCRESLEKAERAFSSQLSEGEKLVVEEQRARRADRLAQAEAELRAATDRQSDMERLLEEGEAYFARVEFLDFCRSKRYRLTPLNTANALAGLPFIGWRRSIARCREVEASGANGGAMQIFKTIESIVRSCVRKSDLVRHAEMWLRSQVGAKSKSYGVSELQKDWFYLRWSIKTVLEAHTRSRDLPYAIAKEYDRRKSHPSNVDVLFAEEERIIVN